MKIQRFLPQITPEEKQYVRERASGKTPNQAYRDTFCPGENIYPPLISRAKYFEKQEKIQAWIKYMEKATPEEMIENMLLEEIAFGDPKDRRGAAKQFLDSQFAGKEVADIFLQRLQQIQAEIVIPCSGRVEKVVLSE